MFTRLREARQREQKAVQEAIKQGIEQGLKQGRDEVYRAWTEWNERRQQAQRNKEPFNEPPPPNPNGNH